jgi:cellulose synthase/poly-beta-1,6-N-acetylglucosamine synthase-like glycosyltransferase
MNDNTENQLVKNQAITCGSQKPAVSIIIPSYNSKRTIRNCLQALDAQVNCQKVANLQGK